MATPILSKEILIEHANAYAKFSFNLTAAARSLNVPRETLRSRLDQLKRNYPKEYEAIIESAKTSDNWFVPPAVHREILNASVMVGGDLHIWPGQRPLMWKAFVAVAKKIKPEMIVLNGDIIDGAKVSRHGRPLGGSAPTVQKEVEAAQDLLHEVPKAKYKEWTLGNHDTRVDSYLANTANELEGYAGRLSDRFPAWNFSYSVVVNKVEIRHRFRGGIHAAWNNALHSGVTIVSNHTHQLGITAVRNRLGTHWGVETGMLGDPRGRQFEYTEGAPSRVQEGFVVLTFDEEGNLYPPEFCEMIRGEPIFRGKKVFG